MSEPFRVKVEPTIETVPGKIDSHAISTSKVEVPYTDYARENGKPYLVDHFELGDRWTDRDGGFSKEVEAIESYLEDQVTNGEVDNSLKGIKDRIKEIEKVTGMNKENRKVIKLEVMAEYVNFLMKTDDIKRNITRYGT